jgi:hypothetical protein
VAEKIGMKKKNPFGATFIAAILVFLVAIYAYVFEFKKANEKKVEEEKSAKVLGIEKDKIKKIVLNRFSGSVELDKAGDHWDLTDPVHDEADQNAVLNLIESMLSEKSSEIVAEGESAIKNLSTYGLDKPITSLLVEGDGIKREVKIGSIKSFDGQLYAQVNQEPKVLLVNASWDDYLSKPIKNLRNRKLMRKPRPETDNFTVSNSNEIIEFTKKDSNWFLAKGGESKTPLDNNSVNAYLEQIKNLQAEDIISEDKKIPPRDPKTKMGKPVLTAELGKKDSYRLDVDSEGHAVSSDTDLIFQIPKAALVNLKKPAGDFYDKHAPFKYDLSKVKSLEIIKGNTHLSLKKDKSWVIESGSRDKELDSAKVDDLLDRLNVLEVDRFLGQKPAEGISEGRNQIVLKDEKGAKLLQVNWGAQFKEKGEKNKEEKYYYIKSNLSPQALLVKDFKLDEMPVASLIKDKVATK